MSTAAASNGSAGSRTSAPARFGAGEDVNVAVLGVGAFVPGYGGVAAWADGRRDAEHAAPRAALVPARQRRRASALSKAFADAYAEALEGTGVEPTQVASVFGSALGEALTMVGLLNQMWQESAMLSPMRFATSVHNAASGLVSIATENRGITTAIGADFDTPAMALFEGIGLACARGEPVVVCCGDEAPPADLVPDGSGWEMLTAALVLAPEGFSDTSLATLGPVEIAEVSSASVPSLVANGAVARNPNMGLLDLVTTIARGGSGEVALDRGAGRGYRVRVVAREDTPSGGT